MAEFFYMNAVPVSIEHGKFKEVTTKVGASDHMHSGQPRRTRRNRRRKWTATTRFNSPSVALEILRIAEGDGEVWTFDDATSPEFGSKGFGARAGSVWTRLTTSPTPKHGAGCIEVDSSDAFEADFALGSSWTILVWKNDSTSDANWVSFALTSAGDFWEDGTKNGSNDPDLWIDVSSGYPALEGKDDAGSVSPTRYDHLVVLPWVMTDAAAAAYTAQSAIAWGLCPRIHLSGDAVPDADGVTVFGEETGTEYTQGNLGEGDGEENNLRKLSLAFEERVT